MKNKMQLILKGLLLTGLMLAISGCSEWDRMDKTEKGAAIGAGSGVAVGAATAGGAGAVIGGAAGGVGGGLIGHELDNEDRARDRRDYERYHE